MAAATPWQSLIDTLNAAPVLAGYARRWHRRRFETTVGQNLFDGVFDSFDAAAASVPARRPIGYDHDDAAALYRRALAVDTYDYPAIHWLQRSFAEGLRTVFDLGGAIGIKYYAFAKHLDNYPDDLRWTVCEVGAAVRQGRAFAEERGQSHRLHFTEDPAELSGVDVLFTSGALQYLPRTLAQMLADAPRKPRRLLVNTTAIHPSRAFFTLNSLGGTAFCPYRVQALDPFCKAIEEQGYVLRDQWLNAGKVLELPVHPEFSLQNYMGFCFDRVN